MVDSQTIRSPKDSPLQQKNSVALVSRSLKPGIIRSIHRPPLPLSLSAKWEPHRPILQTLKDHQRQIILNGILQVRSHLLLNHAMGTPALKSDFSFQHHYQTLGLSAAASGRMCLLPQEDASRTAPGWMRDGCWAGGRGAQQGRPANIFRRPPESLMKLEKKPPLHFEMTVDFMRFVDGHNFQDLYYLFLLADLIEHRERSPYVQSIQLEFQMP